VEDREILTRPSPDWHRKPAAGSLMKHCLLLPEPAVANDRPNAGSWQHSLVILPALPFSIGRHVHDFPVVLQGRSVMQNQAEAGKLCLGG
jgi:hypothetical protein